MKAISLQVLILITHQVVFFLPYSHALFGSTAVNLLCVSPKGAQPFTTRNGGCLRGGASPSAKHDDGDDTTTHAINRVLVLMDGLCSYHGEYLAARARSIPGVAVVSVLSDYVRGYLQLRQQKPDDELSSILPMPKSIEEAKLWKEACLSSIEDSTGIIDDPTKVEWVAVYCESDSGLGDAEKLRELLQTECRDTPTISDARRHKHLQQLTVADAGLAVAQYRLCSSMDTTVTFARELFEQHDHTRVVVKPFRGVASESVYLCSSVSEVETAWKKITSTQVFGSAEQHTNVLVQEFLDGTEYAVDTVSCNGRHKVAAIWRYVKQPANGASFCYFKTELVDGNSDGMSEDMIEEICTYVEASLTALGVGWGFTHTEVIVPLDARGPMLVEVNCRQHNMDFLPIVMSCIGYNAFDMLLIAMLGDGADWNAIPVRPSLQAHGCMVHLVNYALAGRLTSNRHLQDMVDLPSVMDCEVYDAFCTPGSFIEPTVDIRSDAGWAQLVNPDAIALQNDFEQIVRWMPTMFATSQELVREEDLTQTTP